MFVGKTYVKQKCLSWRNDFTDFSNLNESDYGNLVLGNVICDEKMLKVIMEWFSKLFPKQTDCTITTNWYLSQFSIEIKSQNNLGKKMDFRKGRENKKRIVSHYCRSHLLEFQDWLIAFIGWTHTSHDAICIETLYSS